MARRTNAQTVARVVTDIYHDFSRAKKIQHGNLGFNVAKEAIHSYIQSRPAEKNGEYIVDPILLCYLAQSRSFRAWVQKLQPRLVIDVLRLCEVNAASLICFARAQGMDHIHLLEDGDSKAHCENVVWKIPMNCDRFRYVIPATGLGLREHYVPIIHKNHFNRKASEAAQRPPTWLLEHPFPSDPTKFLSPTACYICGCANVRQCNCSRVAHDNRVEIYEFGMKGAGARSLGNITTGTVLGEYMGDIHPFDQSPTPYSVEVDIAPASASEPRVVAIIDASSMGNVFRFLNHSCEPNAQLLVARVGRSLRVIVEAIQEIKLYQEITVDYGPGCLDKCYCGSASCRF